MIYFIRADMSVKIGFVSERASLPERLMSLQCGSPLLLAVAGVMDGDREAEQALHQQFAQDRYHGEWFHLTPEIVDFIETRCRPYMTGIDRLNRSAPVRTMRRLPPKRIVQSRKPAAPVKWGKADIDTFLDVWTKETDGKPTPASTFQKCLAAHWAITYPGKRPPTDTMLGRALGKRYPKIKTGGRQCYFATLQAANNAQGGMQTS